jgi:hypothetical protein
MKYLLAILVFLAGAILPLTLKGQSVLLTSGTTTQAVASQPGLFQVGASGFHRFGAYSHDIVFPPFFGYPSNYPFTYFYPSLWPPLDYEYQQASRIAHGDVDAEVAAQVKEYLASQVQALTDQVQSLRQQQAYRQYAQEAVAPPRTEPPQQLLPRTEAGAQQKFPATVFIYRDGHEMEVRDYAVFGETLWVFNGQTARKFPLADFNLAASRQVNEEHGVEFPLSEQH